MNRGIITWVVVVYIQVVQERLLIKITLKLLIFKEFFPHFGAEIQHESQMEFSAQWCLVLGDAAGGCEVCSGKQTLLLVLRDPCKMVPVTFCVMISALQTVSQMAY